MIHRMPGFKRREILHGLLAVGSAGLLAKGASARAGLRVGVVGGGIVGTSIALNLARAGAQVTLFEKSAPAAGATQNSFAWINAFVEDAHYRALRIESLRAYRELDTPLGLDIVWGGYLDWAAGAPDIDTVRANARQLADSPYPVRSITLDVLSKLDPSLSPGPVAEAFYSPIDGHLDPVFVTRRFLECAAEAGARVLYPCAVTRLDIRRGHLRAVVTTQGAFELDRLVVAAGVDAPGILAMAGFQLRLRHAPGILAHSAPLPALTRPVHDAPGGLSFKQMRDGSVVGTDAPEPPDIPPHQAIRAHATDFPSAELRAYHGSRILTKIAGFLPGAKGVPLDRLTLGFRPMPLDELPVMGALPHLPDVHVAVTHSGVTLAPIIGQLTAREVLGASRAKLFAPYRPERFRNA
jgi:glycine/D-amino acid oxidase-like deaminating enzyme